jgi:hypothetical protein
MKQKIIATVKSAEAQLLKYRFLAVHKKQAKQTLKSIELVKGKTTPHLIKLSDEYAQDVLGWRGYAPWLYVYSAMAGTFHEGWIPDDYYGLVVVPLIQGDYGKLSFLKSLNAKIFNSPDFPDIAYHTNGVYFAKDYSILEEKELRSLLFRNSKIVVFKTDHSYQGRGFFVFDKDSFEPKKIKLLGNGVFQIYLEQHGFFEMLMPDCVATFRITTVIDPSGIVSVRACYLRLGRKADTHVKSSSHIRIPVDVLSGELATFGYMPNWQAIEKHPDTQIPFSKSTIPAFDQFISKALKLHKLMPSVQAIGWDMTLDKNENVKVMEWNGYMNDIKFSEATQGPCFKDLGWEKLWTNS